jgi:primary-amine oxidase
MSSEAGTRAAVAHPLDPLSADEIRTAVRVVRSERNLGETVRFGLVALREPDKELVLSHSPGDPFPRAAEVVLMDKATGAVSEAIVSLDHESIESWRDVPGVQGNIIPEEWFETPEIVLADQEWQAAVRRRGIDDLEHVMVIPVSAGIYGLEHEDKRIVRGVAYFRNGEDDNGYAYPIEGLIATVDLIEKRVVEIWDEFMEGVPPTSARFTADATGPMRTGLKPLEITQPEGPSFTVEGNEIRWQNWSMRVSMHPRTGLVLHTVGYEDNGEVRPVLYRAGLSEVVIPYGDPAQAHFWRAPLDAGEYGLGLPDCVNSLELGCDCLGEIRYLDAVIPDQFGEPITVKNAICIHEEDVGVLWKHVDPLMGGNQVVRSRRLVVSYFYTLGNYDYGFYWHFYLDGMIKHQIKATGIMQPQGMREGERPEYGALIAPRLAAMNHQHLFNFRIDVGVDGQQNSVYEVSAEPQPISDENPWGNAMPLQRRLLGRESEAQSDIDVSRSRHWLISNPNKLNRLGEPVAYRLMPYVEGGVLGGFLLHEDSPLGRRAEFARHTVWVTRHDPDERYAAGDYPNQSAPGQGIPAFQQADRSLENEDVVLWYTVGLSHFPRPEDWPVMPVEMAGFTMKPQGFFDRNPALDVPRPDLCHHTNGGGHNGSRAASQGQ